MTTAQIEDVLALSPLQEGLFSLARLADGGVDVYTMQFVVDVDGPLDVDTLRRSLAAILERHPNLRASFWDRDVPRPVQIVPSRVELPWSERRARPAEFEAVAVDERCRPFDLSRGPALRVLFVTLTSGHRRLLVTAHHIVMDGWAVAVFFTELVAAYQGGGTTLALPPPRPYRDYIGWLAARDAGGRHDDLGRLPARMPRPTDAGARGVRARRCAGADATHPCLRGHRTAHPLGPRAWPHAQHGVAVRLGPGARQAHRPRRCGVRHHGFRAARQPHRRGNDDRPVHQRGSGASPAGR